MKLTEGKLYFLEPIKSASVHGPWGTRNYLYQMSKDNHGHNHDKVAQYYLSQLTCQPIMLVSIKIESTPACVWFIYKFLVGKQETNFRVSEFNVEKFSSHWISLR